MESMGHQSSSIPKRLDLRVSTIAPTNNSMVTLDIHLTGDPESGDHRVWFGGRLGEKGMCKFRNG